jgi:acyl-CoA thioesterase FadM
MHLVIHDSNNLKIARESMSNHRITTKQQPQLFATTTTTTMIMIIRVVIILISWIQVPFSALSFTPINTNSFRLGSNNIKIEREKFQQYYVQDVIRLSSSSAIATSLGTATTATTIINEPSHSSPYSSSTSFISPKFRIYIEDTDAYGVMYNSNYLRSYERALSHVPRQNNVQQQQPDNRRMVLTSITNQKFRSSPALGEEYIIRGDLIQVQQKSASNVTRSVNHKDEEGDDDDDDGLEEIWKLEMVSMSKKKNDTSTGTISSSSTDNIENNDWTVIHNSATVTLTPSAAAYYYSSTTCSSSSTMFENTIIIPKSTTKEITTMQVSNNNDDERKQLKRNNSDNNSGEKMIDHRFIPYHDELELYNNNIMTTSTNNNGYYYNAYHIIPLRNVMNFFERSRTTHLGGPEMLRKLQDEDDLLWFVTNVQDGALFLDSLVLLNDDNNVDEYDDDNMPEKLTMEEFQLLHPTPGREVIVQTSYIPKRRGMIIECNHRLWMEVDHYFDSDSTRDEILDDGGDKDDEKTVDRKRRKKKTVRRLLAQATVTIMALKGSTRRPTKLPQHLMDRILLFRN